MMALFVVLLITTLLACNSFRKVIKFSDIAPSSTRLKSSNEFSIHSSSFYKENNENFVSNTWASINRGGLFNSIELYTSHKETQQLIIDQIANWIQVEKSCDLLPEAISHSTIFASLDGERVIHNVGWKLDGLGLKTAFKMFRDRADSCDGTPAGLKESAHIYDPMFSFPRNSAIQFVSSNPDAYPLLYSIDIYNCRVPDWQDDVVSELQQALSYIVGQDSEPEMKSVHVLKSIDKQTCIVMGAWTGTTGFHTHLDNIEGYKKHMTNVRKRAVHGTMSDITHKSNPSRLFYVADVSLFAID